MKQESNSLSKRNFGESLFWNPEEIAKREAEHERRYSEYINQPLHFEIHITVKTNEIAKFIEDCKEIGIKPIVLELQKANGSGAIQDVMTSSKITGNDWDAFYHMEDVSRKLQSKGFTVVRQKVETVPWHPEALVHDKNTSARYFETHIPIRVPAGTYDALFSVCRGMDLHLSSNVFKKDGDGTDILMATYRKSDVSALDFAISASTIKRFLGFYDIDLVEDKLDIEYALYDSNVDHDAEWVYSKSIA